MQPTLMPSMSWLKMADRRSRWVQVFARLKPGYTAETAEPAHAGAVPPDPPARDDAAGGEGLDRLQPQAVHDGHREADRRVEGLLGPAQPVPHGAHRAARHGRPRPADRLRQRRQPADRPRLRAPAGDRGPPVDRRLARSAGAPAPDREPGPLVPRRAGRHRAVAVFFTRTLLGFIPSEGRSLLVEPTPDCGSSPSPSR